MTEAAGRGTISIVARSTYQLFPSDDGWPYPDSAAVVMGGVEPVADDEIDLDALELQADPHAFDTLSPAEYDLLSRRFGLHGQPESMKELARDLGCSHAEARELLGRAIDKMRTRLTDTT